MYEKERKKEVDKINTDYGDMFTFNFIWLVFNEVYTWINGY